MRRDSQRKKSAQTARVWADKFKKPLPFQAKTFEQEAPPSLFVHEGLFHTPRRLSRVHLRSFTTKSNDSSTYRQALFKLLRLVFGILLTENTRSRIALDTPSNAFRLGSVYPFHIKGEFCFPLLYYYYNILFFTCQVFLQNFLIKLVLNFAIRTSIKVINAFQIESVID